MEEEEEEEEEEERLEPLVDTLTVEAGVETGRTGRGGDEVDRGDEVEVERTRWMREDIEGIDGGHVKQLMDMWIEGEMAAWHWSRHGLWHCAAV